MLTPIVLAETRIGDEQVCDSPKLSEERPGYGITGFFLVESEGFYQFLLGFGVERVRHRISARSRARTSSPETSVTLPSSTSASRRAASITHAS